MSTYRTLLKQITKLGFLLMMGVSMSADAGLFGHTMNWKEEVLLHDGSKIIAERHYNLGGYPAIESQERAALDVTVTFDLPGTNKKITWKTDYDQAKPEPNSLNLIRLDVVKGVPYIATYPAGCIAYNKWGRPNPPQILFKYESDQWRRITLAELPTELINTHANVIVGQPAAKLLKSFYTVEGVNAENHDIDEGPYKTILREAYPGAGGGCMEEIRTGDGWMSLDWFSSQKTYEACLKLCEREKVSAQNCPCNKLFKGK